MVLAAVSLGMTLGAWGSGCVGAVRRFVPLVLAALLPALLVALTLSLGDGTRVETIAALAVAIDLLGLAERLRRLELAGRRLHVSVDAWWDDFEREFRGYVSASSRDSDVKSERRK